ncbi:hypothetical protein ACIQF6_20925 [Kitasatospora sp. NPDC092948]|uniref:hypothetical protein n=1 Tax=Kitasatospora sp. NPDC092948 TaxID=3364088 RepID=UPI00380A44A3
MIASEPVLRGIAANPGAPLAVLLRLLAPEAAAAWPVFVRRRFPDEFVEAVLGSPGAGVRKAIAGNPWLGDDHCLRLAGDRNELVALRLASGRYAERRPRPLSDAVLELIHLGPAGGTEGYLTRSEIAGELYSRGALTGSFRRRMATHPSFELRRQACYFIDELGEAQRSALLDDPDPEVRATARRNHLPEVPTAEELAGAQADRERVYWYSGRPVPPELFEAAVADGHADSLSRNRHLAPDQVRRLAAHPDPQVRRSVAGRSDLTAESAALLAADPDPDVRLRAEVEPVPRRRAQTLVLNRVDGFAVPIDHPWMFVRPVDPPALDWYLACARSPYPLLRRAAATCPDLDAETVRLLAADEDREVRLLLALYHPDAPPGLLLEAYLALPEHRLRLRLRPAFPSRRLPAELVRHDDPEVRELAAADPEFDGDPAALLADPAADVRRAAAANPRTPAATVEALLADPDTAPELLEGAAAGPHLTERRLHELLDRAGVPR